MEPESVKRLNKVLMEMTEEVTRGHIVPVQKEAFLCCARCCDNPSDLMQMQQCVQNCSMAPMQQQKMIQQVMQDFQERFQRCAMRCQDEAREMVSYQPTSAEQSKAQERMNKCVGVCGEDFLGKVPKLKSDIIGQLRR